MKITSEGVAILALFASSSLRSWLEATAALQMNSVCCLSASCLCLPSKLNLSASHLSLAHQFSVSAASPLRGDLLSASQTRQLTSNNKK